MTFAVAIKRMYLDLSLPLRLYTGGEFFSQYKSKCVTNSRNIKEHSGIKVSSAEANVSNIEKVFFLKG